MYDITNDKMQCVLIFGVFSTILMLSKRYLSEKECKCCFTRLSAFKKGDIREISSLNTLRKLNQARKKIRSRSCARKNKIDDDSLIELNDFVCKRCISYANYEDIKLVKSKRMRALSPEREISEANYQFF